MSNVLLMNARIATMRAGRYSLIEAGAMKVDQGRISWIGPMDKMDPRIRRERGTAEIDLQGSLVTPGLIDCHTHLVYAGNRAREWEMRLQGVSYAEISRAGGGILSTVRQTRAASADELRSQSLPRLDALMAEGCTTVEIKSGYGLDTRNELKCLRVARSLASGRRVRIRTTLLGAHAVAPEFDGRPELYVDMVCGEMIPAAAKEGIADAVDAFCENIAFTPEQTRRVFRTARKHGLKVKIHADQLSNSSGARIAAEFEALSADHLEHTDEDGVAAIARAGTVAVLLPGAFYYLRETKVPPVDLLRKHKVAMAVATDCNPGTSPISSPLAILNMACTLFRLAPEEALAGMTCHAARALGLEREIGTLEIGKTADFALWPVREPAELCASIGSLRPDAVFFDGERRGLLTQEWSDPLAEAPVNSTG